MSSAPEPNPTFEEALQSLQQIVADLESGSITLDESLLRFETGIGLLRQCYQFLERAEQRIEQLVSLDAQGNCTLVAFDATSTVEKQSKAATKSTAKRASRAREPEAPSQAPDLPVDEMDAPGKLLF